jgi:hypothetical protein
MTTPTDYLKNSLKLWQDYTQAYTDFVLEATQQNVKQSLALRERLDQVVAEMYKQAETLSAQEQEIALKAAETFQAQARAAAERLSKGFTPPKA